MSELKEIEVTHEYPYVLEAVENDNYTNIIIEQTPLGLEIETKLRDTNTTFPYIRRKKSLSISGVDSGTILTGSTAVVSEDYDFEIKYRYLKRYNTLKTSFNKELKRLSNKGPEISTSVIVLSSSFMKDLSRLPFGKGAVELIPNILLKFTLNFPENKLLMLTISLESGISVGQVHYSFFINRKLIASDVTEFQAFIKSFKEYISM